MLHGTGGRQGAHGWLSEMSRERAILASFRYRRDSQSCPGLALEFQPLAISGDLQEICELAVISNFRS